jgi:sugar phosphate isomerase/epimerase
LETDRRNFIRTTAAAGAGLACGALPSPGEVAAPPRRRGIKLGFDNFSLRAWEWKAEQLLEYTADQKLDVMLFSDLKVYRSHEEGYLRQLKAKADRLGVEVQVGTYSICPTSKVVTRDYGTPEEHLTLALRIAKTLGSPVLRCVLGRADDRKVDGGIERQIENTVKVLRNVRSRALDAGVKIAVENHSGDMQAWELVTLIEAAGKEFVGATMDCGNAARTLEDPLVNLEILGPHVLTTNIRDSAAWEIHQGAQVKWAALGEGNVDWKTYLDRFVALCPGVPFVLEIISQYGWALPYFDDDFWKPYPKVRAREFARFVAFAKRGKPVPPFQAPPGVDAKQYEKQFQRAELERSLKYCREVLRLCR